MHQGLDLLREMNLRFCKPFNGTLLAQLQAQAGRIDEGLGTLDVGLATVENTGERWFHSEIYRMRGLLLQRRTPANLGESESALLRALEIARGQRTRTFELRAAISLASLYQSSGREHAARTTLEAALAKFPERGELPEFREADHVLAQLAEEPGRAGTTARAAPPGWGQTPREGR